MKNDGLFGRFEEFLKILGCFAGDRESNLYFVETEDCFGLIEYTMEKYGRRVAVSGATGFIGSRLVEYLTNTGWVPVLLSRDMLHDGGAARLRQALDGCEAVINLAGAPIDRRWTAAYRREIYDSRIGVTRRLVQTLNAMTQQPRVLISASAVGYYPESGCYDEYTLAQGSGLLADVCRAWEYEAHKIDPRIRLVVPRFGVVLAPSGGAFRRMTLPMRLGIAARIGSGRQPFSWIAREDLVRILALALTDERLSGVVNCVVPERLDNREFTRIVGSYYHDRIHVAIPRWVLRMIYGARASVLTGGNCAIPAKLTEIGYSYQSPDLIRFLSGLPRV